MTGFGLTWWGRAWVRALEESAGVDAARLARGRVYAGQDRVEHLDIGAGSATASVRGSQRLRYRTHVRVRTYPEDMWSALAGNVASTAGRTAALLDGDLDPSLADEAAAMGMDLLPSPGDLEMTCSCPDRGDPCKHSAAVAYLVAEALDDDPFVLFALRGRPRERFLEDLHAEREDRREVDDAADRLALERLVSAGPDGTGADPGEVARDSWARPRSDLPPLPDVPDGSAPTAAWPDDPPAEAPFDAPGLLALAADAAHRARRQLLGKDGSGLDLDREADLVRRSEATGAALDPATAEDPSGRAAAWRHGGDRGLALLAEPAWQAPVDRMAVGRRAALAAGIAAGSITVTEDRITLPGTQLRISRDELWWRFEKRGDRWELAAPPSADPADLLGVGLRPGRSRS